ncbi:MAG TPA: calcium-binding protein, partial [Fimbriiglobus sp.]|nr:calcium-binding protein [Fimbriiglobus sp.]
MNGTPSRQRPSHRVDTFRSRPRVEWLEDRSAPSVSYVETPPLSGQYTVTFAEAGAADALILRRGSSGLLEYSLNGAPFSTDLSSTDPGVQPLSLAVISQVVVGLGGGNDSLTLDFSGGQVIPGLSGVSFDGGPGVDRVVAARDIDMTLSDAVLLFGPGGSGGVVALSGVEQARLTGGNSPNLIDARGFTGTVTVGGGNQTDTVYGGSGNDFLSGDEGSDQLFGMGGNDVLDSTNSGNAQMFGGEGDDLLIGGNGKDLMAGEGGHDTLAGGNGADTLLGGTGNDTLEGQSGNDLVDGGAGTDEVVATGSVSFVLTDVQLTGLGTDTLVSIEAARLTGGTNNNTIDGSGFSGRLTMDGGGGTDTLIGGTGENIYLKPTGQGGTTAMIGGGPGATNKFNLSPSGSVSLLDNGGFSEVSFAASPTGITLNLGLSGGTPQDVDGNGFLVSLIGLIENAFGTASRDSLTGNELTNYLDGGEGGDIVYGGAFGIGSRDTLVGGEGDDSVLG